VLADIDLRGGDRHHERSPAMRVAESVAGRARRVMKFSHPAVRHEETSQLAVIHSRYCTFHRHRRTRPESR